MINLFKTQAIKDKINANPAKYQEIIDEETEYAICITDPHGQFKAINKKYTEIYGYVGPEIHGKHFTLVSPPETVDELARMHDKFLKDQREISRKWQVVTKWGQRIWINADARYTNKIDNAPHKLTFIELAQ